MPSASQLLPFLEQIDANQWYSNFGPLNVEFESFTLKQIGDDPSIHAVSLASGHLALEFAVRAQFSDPGKRILVPALTFASTAHAILNMGNHIVLADVDQENWCLTPKIAEAALEDGVHFDAVMPVAVYGRPLDSDSWDAFSCKHGIPVIMDAAAAFDAQSIPRHSIICHSLHATKPFGIGEGGLQITRNKDFADTVRTAANFGFESRISHQWGGNAKLSEYHAAVGLAQAARWDDRKKLRRALMVYYRDALKKVEGLTFQKNHPQTIPSTLGILLNPKNPPKMVQNALSAALIGTERPYLPLVHHHPYFKDILRKTRHSIVPSGLSVCEDISQRIVALPFHTMLSHDDIDRVVSVLAHVVR